jgi:hypothetical protein
MKPMPYVLTHHHSSAHSHCKGAQLQHTGRCIPLKEASAVAMLKTASAHSRSSSAAAGGSLVFMALPEHIRGQVCILIHFYIRTSGPATQLYGFGTC